jgi:hypothetical protein
MTQLLSEATCVQEDEVAFAHFLEALEDLMSGKE